MPPPTEAKGKKDGLVVLDFDGVIADSIHDSWLTTVNAFIEMEPDHGLPLDVPLRPNDVFDFERRHPALFADFRRLIPLGNQAANYLVMIRLIAQREADRIRDQKDFDALESLIPIDFRERFGSIFYQKRIRLQDSDPGAWAGIIPSFPGLPETVHDLNERLHLAIATSKDRWSVDYLLRWYGIADCFPSNMILDKNFSYYKKLHLEYFKEKTGIPFDRIHFVDDKVLHLVEVKELGVHNHLAVWGFNTEREWAVARREEIHLLTLEGLKNLE
jgi:phosphoglycolate phosphatase-like HAD superfamily hydrolase